VRPSKFKTITDFCINLTGVTQADVDAASEFSCVWQQWKDFMNRYPNTLLVICGDWALRRMLREQWDLSGMRPTDSLPEVLEQAAAHTVTRAEQFYPLPHWCNIKNIFDEVFAKAAADMGEVPPSKVGGMVHMLALFGIEFSGKSRNGIDDCRNIGKCLLTLIWAFEEESVLRVTSEAT